MLGNLLSVETHMRVAHVSRNQKRNLTFRNLLSAKTNLQVMS